MAGLSTQVARRTAVEPDSSVVRVSQVSRRVLIDTTSADPDAPYALVTQIARRVLINTAIPEQTGFVQVVMVG